jgi:hypothetical protein
LAAQALDIPGYSLWSLAEAEYRTALTPEGKADKQGQNDDSIDGLHRWISPHPAPDRHGGSTLRQALLILL